MQRQQLIHTTVVNARGEHSERFIEQEVFELWQPLVESRHALVINQPFTCIWLPRESVLANDNIYAHAPFRADVYRMEFECFAAGSSITRRKARYVPAAHMPFMAGLLTAHLKRRHTHVHMQVAPGVVLGEHRTTPDTSGVSASTPHMAPSCSIPRGFAPAKSAMRS